MFVDLVDSTALSAVLDPEDMRIAITSYQNTVAGEVTRFDGHVAKYMGDGVLCYFGWPYAHEDDAERAIRAGLAIMQALVGQYAANGQALAARAGIATGLVVVGDLVGVGAAQEQAVVGETPNLAARLQGLAQLNQVVLSEKTRELIANVFELQDLGEHQLKGIHGSVQAYAAVGEKRSESRFAAQQSLKLSQFTGRDGELALLIDRWHKAKAGEGQVVLLSGEAGIGKSRITRELIKSLAENAYTRVTYQCSPHHADSVLYPAIQQILHGAGILSTDSSSQQLSKLESFVEMSAGDASKLVPVLAKLLNMDAGDKYPALTLSPQELRAITFDSLTRMLMDLSSTQPVLFILEDLHWVDPTTLEPCTTNHSAN